MAGIGFELKKLFHRKGLVAMVRAYGYAGVICTGPMLLGILLQFGVLAVSGWWHVPRADQNLLVCMITYTLLASLVLTSFLSMLVTRFLADMLFEHHEETILPSFWGSTTLMLAVGAVLYAVFLLFSGATLMQGLLCLWLFLEMIVNWNAMSYLTAIKDYQGIMWSFVAAVVVVFLSACAMMALGLPQVESLLAAVAFGYGVRMVWDVVLLHRYFPQSSESPWTFLKWVDEFLPLAFTGLCTNIGLFAHLVICWVGPVGVQVKGLFYGAPYYDVPALHRLFDHPHHQHQLCGVGGGATSTPSTGTYYSLFNDGGVVGDIVTAEEEMLAVLNRELWSHGPQAALRHGGGPLAGGDAAGVAAAGLQRPDARLFPHPLRGVRPLRGGQHHPDDFALLHGLPRRGHGCRRVCGVRQRIHGPVHGVQHRVLRLRLPHRGRAVLSGHAAPAGRLYGQPAVSGPGPAAHRGRDQGRAVHPAGPVSGNQIGSACKTRRRRGEGR